MLKRYPRSDVFSIPIEDLKTDPKKFQYKLVTYDDYGSTNSLLGIKKWNDTLAGTILVWLNPIDNQIYIVNGHNRYSKAKALKVKSLKCEFIEAKTATQARSIGALKNIAEGMGTAIDAAKYFRDSGLSEHQIKQKGILPLSSLIVKNAIKLSNLNDYLFGWVIEDRLSIRDGVTIGNYLPLDRQLEIIEVLNKDVTDKALIEYCQLITGYDPSLGQLSLFGEDFANTAIKKAEIIAYTKQRLATESKLFGTVAKNSNLLELGNNTIDKKASKSVSDTAKNALQLFDQLKFQAGKLSHLISEAASGLIDRDHYYGEVLTVLSNPLSL
jgi:hypothetical protein